MFARKRSWDRYLAAAQAQRAQGAGTDPAPAGREKVPDSAKKPRRTGRRSVRATGRVLLAAARTAGGLLEFGLWLTLNTAIALAVVLAAQAAGAHLPPWLTATADFIQNLLSRAAHALGL